MTSRLPITSLTKQIFLKYIASSNDIGNPSHNDGKIKKSTFLIILNASSRLIHPVIVMFGEVSSVLSSPSPIQMKLISGNNLAISLKSLGFF